MQAGVEVSKHDISLYPGQPNGSSIPPGFECIDAMYNPLKNIIIIIIIIDNNNSNDNEMTHTQHAACTHVRMHAHGHKC